MIAVDTNVLVYAHRKDMPFHARARDVVRELAEGAGSWSIPWPCVHEFIGIVTHRRIFKHPTPIERALSQMRAWLGAPGVALLAEGPGYWDQLALLVEAAQVAGPKVHDARIAAICLHNGVQELWTADRDFGRFPVLRTRNPLVD